MIPRLIALCASGAMAYALLGGAPAGMPALLRSCLAVLLLVGGLVWWAVGRKAKEDLPVAAGSASPRPGDYLLVGTGVLALECAFLWLLSAAPAPLEDVALRIEARLQPGAAAQRAANAAPAAASGNWLWGDEGRRSLPRRTNLKPGVKPEVFVRLSREADAKLLLQRKTYVRAFALDDFRKGVWSTRKPGDKGMVADQAGWIRLGSRTDPEILHEVFHGKDGGGRDVLTALQGVKAARLPELRVASDGMALLPAMGGTDGYRYMASSVPLGLEDLKGKRLRWDVSEKAGEGRFAELAAKAAGDGTVLEKLLNVEAFLRDNYGYSLVTENPRDLDPLDNFLFGEKKGHCEFFATAGALMARELGVGSRIAYGWAGGEYFKESMMFVFRAREAHAWVEVDVPGYGWVVMEPTPPVVLGGGGMPRAAGAGEQPPSPDEILAEDESPVLAQDNHVERISLRLMAAFGILALAALIAKSLRRRRPGGSVQMPGLAKEVGYSGAWKRACENRGLKWPAGVTLRRRLDEIDGRPEFGDELLGYDYGRKYQDVPADPEAERRLLERIRKWG